MAALRTSDVIFAALEGGKPADALAMQMGYAKALGKHVILVDQKSATEPAAAASLEPLAALADAPFPTLAEGITYLQERLKLM